MISPDICLLYEWYFFCLLIFIKTALRHLDYGAELLCARFWATSNYVLHSHHSFEIFNFKIFVISWIKYHIRENKKHHFWKLGGISLRTSCSSTQSYWFQKEPQCKGHFQGCKGLCPDILINPRSISFTIPLPMYAVCSCFEMRSTT